MKVFEYAKSGTGLRLVDSGRKPFGPKKLLTIGNRPVFAPAEIDRHEVYTVRMNDYEIFVSGLRNNAWGIDMAELYS